MQSPVSALTHAGGVFHELPGSPPELEARRQAFRAVMRRLLTPTTPQPDHPDEHDDDEERPDEAA